MSVITELTPSFRTYEIRGQEKKKSKQQKQRQTSTSHSPTKTISINHTSPLKAVTAVQACNEYVSDAFINGLSPNAIRQRLLQNKMLDLQSAHALALSLEMAQKQSASCQQTSVGLDSVATATRSRPNPHESGLGYTSDVSLIISSLTANESHPEDSALASATAATNTNSCFFCGNSKHP